MTELISQLATIDDAVAALRAGRPVLVLDDADRENEGDVVLAVDTLTPEWLAWTIRHTSGYLCAPLPDDWADRLGLPLMVRDNQDPRRTQYTVSVDASTGVSTGISARDRTRTLKVLADPHSEAADLIRPGHVLPLRARDGGVLERRGHTEAAVDLCRLAGLAPVAVIAELVHDAGSMMRGSDVLALGRGYNLPVIAIEQLYQWRMRHDRVVEEARTRLPLAGGTYSAVGFLDRVTGDEHVAVVSPLGLESEEPGAPAPLIRVHSECLTGDVFGSQRCDCGEQLDAALKLLATEPGAVIYLRGHEGRGVGLLSKLQAYRLQDGGADTVDAQIQLGLPIDDREYGAAAAILYALGADRIRLLSNNPAKKTELERFGVEVVESVPLETTPTQANARYLRTKRDRMGHVLSLN